MASLNVMKLLESCKVLSDHSILLLADCPCHNKIDGEQTLDILVDGPEPVLRCRKCGMSYCAPSFMMARLGMPDQEVAERLCQAGYSRGEANNAVYRAIKYLRFTRSFDSARADYREKQRSGEAKHASFGDWGLMSGNDINYHFFAKASSRLNPKIGYNMLLLRDENGIPSSGMIYTTGGSLIGEVKIPMPSGNVSFVAERWTDFVSWSRKIIAVPNTMLAAQVSKASVKPDGSFSDPVGVVFTSSGEASYFSRLKPQILVLAGQFESVYQTTPLHGKFSPAHVCRLPGDTSNGFGISGALEEELARMRPRLLSQDIISMLLESKKTSVKDFCNAISQCSNASSFFRNELVEAYSVATGSDKKTVGETVASVTSSIGHFSIARRTFKVHQGAYCEMGSDLSINPVSNFWVSVNYAAIGERDNIEYNVTLYMDDQSQDFFVDHDTFQSYQKLMSKIVTVAMTSGMPHPMWVSKRCIFEVMPSIIRGLSGKKIPSVKKFKSGFDGSEFVTGEWRVSRNGIIAEKTELGGSQPAIDNPDLSNLSAYRKSAKIHISELCNTLYGASLVACAFELICKLSTGKSCHLAAPKNVVNGLAKLLGIRVQEVPEKTGMIQAIGRVLSKYVTRTHECTISVAGPNGVRKEWYLNLDADTPTEGCGPSFSVLPFLWELVLSGGVEKARKKLDSIIGDRDRISKLRTAQYNLSYGGSRLEEFARLLVKDRRFKDHVLFCDGETKIFSSAFPALSSAGHKFNKSGIISEIKSGHPSARYPVEDPETRKVCLTINNPNIFTQKKDPEEKWKNRSISLTQ